MRVNECVGCVEFPCADVNQDRYILPEADLLPDDISRRGYPTWTTRLASDSPWVEPSPIPKNVLDV